MKLNYAIICYKQLDEDRIQVKHSCLYENKPTQVDFDSLQMELATDKEFNMIGDDDYEMALIDKTSKLWSTFNLPTDINDDKVHY